MSLVWWPLTLLVLLVAIAGVAVLWWRERGRSDGDAVLAAHTDRLTRLPRYRAALARLRLRLIALGAVLALVLVVGAWTAGRPSRESSTTPEVRTRDIVLCLDVSGSMTAVDKAVVERFSTIVEGFEGERIALVFFDGRAVTAFPLTDDYEFVVERLDEAAAGFDGLSRGGTDPAAGTYAEGGSSLIGDGLASCVLAFDRKGEKRSRSVVLATDNMVNGPQVYTVPEAAALAKESDIRVYALNPNPFPGTEGAELEQAAARTGGKAFALEDEGAVDGVVDDVERTEAAKAPKAPAVTRDDRPRWPLLLLSLLLGGYALAAWWWRR